MNTNFVRQLFVLREIFMSDGIQYIINYWLVPNILHERRYQMEESIKNSHSKMEHSPFLKKTLKRQQMNSVKYWIKLKAIVFCSWLGYFQRHVLFHLKTCLWWDKTLKKVVRNEYEFISKLRLLYIKISIVSTVRTFMYKNESTVQNS